MNITTFKGVTFFPYDELYRHALTQVPADILQDILDEIERIETEAFIIMVSQIA